VKPRQPVDLAKDNKVELRQSYERVVKREAGETRRAYIRTRLGRVISRYQL
jgi:hypothetical protein